LQSTATTINTNYLIGNRGIFQATLGGFDYIYIFLIFLSSPVSKLKIFLTNARISGWKWR
jgi:hypothetical protein